MTASLPMHRARPGAEAVWPAAQTEATEVAPGIWMSQGLSNSYMLTTSEERVIINTGVPFESLVHKELFDAVDTGPTRYIIVTQGHPDHFGGVDTFREPDTDVVMQENWPIWRDEYFVGVLNGFRSRAGFAWSEQVRTGLKQATERFGNALVELPDPKPTIVVDEHQSLKVGGRRLELYSTPGGETTDSMVVWLPEERIVFTGNLFGPLFGHVPNLVTLRGDRYRDPLLYLESLAFVRSLGAEVLITGHFDPVVGATLIDDELRRMGEATRYVHDETLRGMNAGHDVHTLMRDVVVPAELEVGEGYGKNSWNVRAIWEIYTGWFHHHSTTELYGVPQDAVHGDLVELAGGAKVLVARAAAHLAAGHGLEAIHLLDIVLGVEPDDSEARARYADAHRALLADAQNFWERKWLEHQIRRGTSEWAPPEPTRPVFVRGPGPISERTGLA